MAPVYGLDGIKQSLQKVAKKIDGQSVTVSWPVLPAPLFYWTGPESSGDGSDITEDLQKRHERGVEAVARGLEIHLDNMMEASWGWIEGARDIVDSGQLKNSARVMIQGDQIIVGYVSDYANLVHYGGYIQPYGNVNIDRVYLPARPWVAATFGEAGGPMQPYDWMAAYLEAASY